MTAHDLKNTRKGNRIVMAVTSGNDESGVERKKYAIFHSTEMPNHTKPHMRAKHYSVLWVDQPGSIATDVRGRVQEYLNALLFMSADWFTDSIEGNLPGDPVMVLPRIVVTLEEVGAEDEQPALPRAPLLLGKKVATAPKPAIPAQRELEFAKPAPKPLVLGTKKALLFKK